MRRADAVNASPTRRAERRAGTTGTLGDDEPNIVLLDARPHEKGINKAFQARESFGWRRVQIKHADRYDDWQPVERTSFD